MTRDSLTIRVQSDRLKTGMKVVELDRPWANSPFTTHGFIIRTEQQIQQLQACCQYVYVERKPNAATSITRTDLANRQQYTNTTTFQQAIPKTQKTYQQAKSVVHGFFNNLRLGKGFDSAVAKNTVKQCVDSVIENQEAMLWLGLLKDVDEYTARHSLNVGLLSIILGRAEGLARNDLETVGLCGLLHDMGKAEIPLEILNKEGSFTDDEYAIMKTHTTLGYQILKGKSDIVKEAANVAYSHHERLNGFGYPRNLASGDISYFSRIVAISDTYDAITSKRIYSPAKSSLEGLRILMGAKDSHFDPDLVDRFVECIGLYPSGSIAELSTGEVGIILPVPPEQREKPKVLILRNKKKKPCDERLIDLSKIPDVGEGAITVKHLLSDGALGIELAKYHERATTLAG